MAAPYQSSLRNWFVRFHFSFRSKRNQQLVGHYYWAHVPCVPGIRCIHLMSGYSLEIQYKPFSLTESKNSGLMCMFKIKMRNQYVRWFKWQHFENVSHRLKSTAKNGGKDCIPIERNQIVIQRNGNDYDPGA